MRFAYYSQLSRRNKAVYRKSDAITEVALPALDDLRLLAEAVRESIDGEDRRGVQRAVNRLCKMMLEALELPRVKVRVLATRPSSAESELHGLYEAAEGEVAIIKVWMRTATKSQVVKYRTFLRTLLHEVCHHLDYEQLGLADSFHTQGFFRRESSLMRQLAPKPPRKPRPRPATAAEPGGRRPRKSRASAQLELPLG